MVSNKSWEKFKKDVEELTKTGVERQSWGRRSFSKDPNEGLSRKQNKSTLKECSPPEASLKSAKTAERCEIEGFSSSDDEPQNYSVCEVPRKISPLAKKRSCSRSVPVKKRRRKKFGSSELKDFGQSFHHGQSTSYHNDMLDKTVSEWSTVSHHFENSDTIVEAVSPPIELPQDDGSPRIVVGEEENDGQDRLTKTVSEWSTALHHFENSFTATAAVSSNPDQVPQDDTSPMIVIGKQENERNSELDITWSDSDPNEFNMVVEHAALVRSLNLFPTSKVPCSAFENDLSEELPGKPKADIENDIDEFNSDSEKPQAILSNITDETHSPSISPNSPTPTPTSPNIENCPPINSTKKRKQKYLRSGLAEKLRKLLMRQKSEKSFWLHKLRQMKDEREDSNDCVPKSTAERTVTLRVLHRNLDHGVCVMTCDVIIHDVISDRELPGQVTILLEKETTQQLDFSSKPLYLRIHPPWKIFDLPNSPIPVLLCITHCEVVQRASLDEFVQSHLNDETHAAYSTDNDLVEDKAIRTQLFVPNVSGDAGECSGLSEAKDLETETVNDIRLGIVSRNLMDAVGVQGQCVNDRINVIARVQRIYWRHTREKNQMLPCASSLVQSIIENAKLVEPSNNIISWSLLVQDSFGFFSEILLPSEMLLSGRNWYEMLSKNEGKVFTFRGLKLLEHRKRKRRLDILEMIDFLKDTKSTDKPPEYNEKQNSYFTFCIDQSTILEEFIEDEDVLPYLAHQFLTVDNLQLDGTCERVSFYGKLLYATFQTDQRYAINNARLFLSAIITGGPLRNDGGDVSTKTVCDHVIQVRYRSRTSGPGWSEASLVVGHLMYIQDAVVDNDNRTILSADSFSLVKFLHSQSTLSGGEVPSHIGDLWSKMMYVSIDDETYGRLKDLPHTVLPSLDVETQSNSLVRFEGIIFDVDQANAFCWFTCNECGSDDIYELPETSLYVCNSCGLDISSPVTNTHLEVYLKSVHPPPLCVKAKLLQSTVSRLLPVSDSSTDEGHDVQCILHKHLGSTSWYVLKKCDDGESEEDRRTRFNLQEIDTTNW